MKTVKLSSKCNVKGAEGGPGDVVTVSDKQAAAIIAGRGGVEVAADGGDDAKARPGRRRQADESLPVQEGK